MDNSKLEEERVKAGLLLKEHEPAANDRMRDKTFNPRFEVAVLKFMICVAAAGLLLMAVSALYDHWAVATDPSASKTS